MPDPTHAEIAKARADFLQLVGDVRPELHRYCARLTGSVIEGEDIVQETLARAFYVLSINPENIPLRPWLFRIAHNAALDFLKSHGRQNTETRAEMAELAGAEEPADPLVVRAALSHFLVLPLVQRSAVILKDVLGHSLEEVADTMGSTIMAVKAALVRGRANLRAGAEAESRSASGSKEDLERYARAFNARDWDGVRAMVAEDCRLDLVSRSQRRGKEVGVYFTRYVEEQVQLRLVRIDGELAFGAYTAASARPGYFILLEWADGRVKTIRDFRYVPYIAAEAEYQEL